MRLPQGGLDDHKVFQPVESVVRPQFAHSSPWWKSSYTAIMVRMAENESEAVMREQLEALGFKVERIETAEKLGERRGSK